MKEYFFILGRNPILSSAEIKAVLQKQQIPFTIECSSDEVLIVSTAAIIDIPDIMKTLGGIIKAGEIVDRVNLDDSEEKFEFLFSSDNILSKYMPVSGGKVHFGISIYRCSGEEEIFLKLTDNLKEFHKTIKENLKERGVKAGFVQIKERYLSSVSVVKNELLTKGAEIVLVLTKENILAGRTDSVQEFESFSFRDMGRPAKDKRSGIMPPKLARIMINLASCDKKGTVLDPFCGSGTIIQELMILGYRHIKGSDISHKAIRDTNENINWLFGNFRNLNPKEYDLEIIQKDVNNISGKIPLSSIDAIVTEPFIGPPLHSRINISTIRQTFSILSRLYLAAFAEFAKICKKGAPVVFIFPSFEESGKKYYLEIIKQIENMGFRAEKLINGESGVTDRNSIIYGDRDYFVMREIFKFVKS